MFLITGSGQSVALLNVESKLPMLIGPATRSPFFRKVTFELGCVQSEPWKTWLFEPPLTPKLIAVVLEASAASVSIEVLPLEPCQFVGQSRLVQPATAQICVLLPT